MAVPATLLTTLTATASAATAVQQVFKGSPATLRATAWWNNTAGDGGNFVLKDERCDDLGAYIDLAVGNDNPQRLTLGTGCNTEKKFNVSGQAGTLIGFQVCVDNSWSFEKCSGWQTSRI